MDKIAQKAKASSKFKSESSFNYQAKENVQQDIDGVSARDRYFSKYFLFNC